MNIACHRLSIDATGHFLQLVVATGTTRLQKMACETNILRYHHANSRNIRAREKS